MKIHWFAFTMFGDRQEFDAFYKVLLGDTFGDYVEYGHGGRGYRPIATNSAGVRLYFDPISIDSKGNHIYVEIPGGLRLFDTGYFPRYDALFHKWQTQGR